MFLKLLKRKTPTEDNSGRVVLEKELVEDSKRILSSFVLTLISAILTVPLFILLYRYMPDIRIPVGEGFNVEGVLLVIVIFALLRVTAYFVRFFLYGASVVMLVVLLVGQLVGGFGFSDVYRSYYDLLTYVGTNPIKIPFLGEVKSNIPDGEKIRSAINYKDPVVRDFALRAAQRYFTEAHVPYEYRNQRKYFSIFKVMYRWEYVSDPKWEEYYASASESIPLMSGDCDDYSILMAACIKAVGGEVRLVRTSAHLYPEVKVGTYEELPAIVDLIKNRLFYKESLGERIYYHQDGWNNIWLNFDYTRNYPGGAFLAEDIVGIMEI